MDDGRLIANLGSESDVLKAFRELVRIAPVGICLTDRDRRFVLVNRSYCETYGYTEEELIGQPFTNVLPEEDRAFAGEVHDAFLDGQTDESAGRWRVVRKDGAIRTVLVGAARLITASGHVFKLTTVQDVTEDDEKAVAKVMADNARLLSQVTAIAGHDLTNILSSLLLDAEILKERLIRTGAECKKSDEILNDLIAGIERARQLVQRLRSVALPPAERRMLVDPIVELNRLPMSYGGRCVIVDIATEGFLRLHVDPWQFQAALAALIENALAAQTEKDPLQPITVRLRSSRTDEVEAGGLQPQLSPTGFIAIDVIDTGPGMDDKTLQAARSGQLASRLLNVVQKTQGLGLMVARSFAAAHQGAFILQSSLGIGTRATLILPVRRVQSHRTNSPFSPT